MKFENGKLLLSEDSKLDTLEIDNKIFQLEYIDPENPGNKGGNSYVFVLKDPDNEIHNRIVKFSKIYSPLPIGYSNSVKEIRRRFLRFEYEIEALYKAQKFNYIVKIFSDGSKDIEGKSFRWYVMEKADSDLTKYVLNNQNIDEQERLKFCYQLYNALTELNSLKIYHRDIKPDNIFLFYDDDKALSKKWKIGDLGLISYGDRELNLDYRGQKIGPFGWLSPEAMNKFLTEKFKLGLDCKIDDKSDIFQLGKVFWFIYQNNVPIGRTDMTDFKQLKFYNNEIYEMICSMLCHSKENRCNLTQLNNSFEPIIKGLGV